MQNRLWMQLEGMRQTARSADDHTFLADGRENAENAGRTLEVLLQEHQPKDGSALCPGCSHGRCRAAWPCPVVLRIAYEMGLAW